MLDAGGGIDAGMPGRADAGHAATMRDRARKSRRRARDAARHAATADGMAGAHLRDAGKLDACASAASAARIPVGEGRLRELTLVRSDMWDNAKRNRPVSPALGENERP